MKVGFAILLVGAASIGGGAINPNRSIATVSDQIALVAIDQKSLTKVGPWPWSRETHAQLVGRLAKLGVKRIIFDVDFSRRGTNVEDSALDAAISRAGRPVFLAVSPPGVRSNFPNPIVSAHSRLAFAGGIEGDDHVIRDIPYPLLTFFVAPGKAR